MITFTSYDPCLPISIVMSPVMILGKASFPSPVSEEKLLDCHFNNNPEHLTITVFKEFEYVMTEGFIRSTVAKLIEKSIQTPNAALLLTPKISDTVKSMENLGTMLEHSAIGADHYMIEKSTNPEKERECFGAYIQGGAAYFFGKSVDKDSLEYHRVPETNIVISICWEADFLGRLKRQLFDLGACLVLHPSANTCGAIYSERYTNPKESFPMNVKATNIRWRRTVKLLSIINPHINFIHVDYGASGMYLDAIIDHRPSSLETIKEMTSDACVVQRVLRFSSRFTDKATHEKTIHDRKFNEAIAVPDCDGCTIM